MPVNRNTAPGRREFFSSVITRNASNHAGPRRTPSGSWIVTELQAAQQQIQQTLQTAASLDPTATPFYLHPRQSTFADLESINEHQQQQEERQPLLSPQTVQAARAVYNDLSNRTRRPSDALIEDYLAQEDGEHGEGSEMEADFGGNNNDMMDFSLDGGSDGLQFNVSALSNSATAGVPIQLQQALRNAAAIHNSVGMTVQSLRASAIANNNNNNNNNIPSTTNRSSMNPAHSALRNKIVYKLECAYCCTHVCDRAMRAILLADTKIELYSTDIPPRALRTMDEDRLTQGCNCRIRDTVCSGCGNVLGYHVSQPCDRCLDARNNGHFWMFYSEGVQPAERKDIDGSGPLFWASLTPMCEFVPASACNRPGLAGNSAGFDSLCR